MICAIMGHERSASRVRREGESLRTICRRCKAPMIKDEAGEWKIIRIDRDPESDRFGRDAEDQTD